MKKSILFKVLVLLTFTFNAGSLKADQFEKQFLSYSVFANAQESNATKASVKARNEAKKIAISGLLNKVVLKKDRPKIQALLENSATDKLVSRMRISNEVVSRVAYSADFDFEFDSERMVSFLLDSNLKFVYLGKQVDLLVIPLFKNNNTKKTLLWESGNSWKNALYSIKENYQAGIYSVDNTNVALEDVDKVNESELIYSNVLEKARIINSAAEGVFITELSLKDDLYVLKVTHLDDQKEILVKSYSEKELIAQGKVKEGEILNYIANDVVLELNDYFLEKAYQIITSEAKDSYFILYFNDLNKLVRFKKQLKDIISVDSFTVEKFYSNKVILKVKHKNKLEAIDKDLRALGFYVESIQKSLSLNIATVEECLNSVCTNNAI